MKNIKTHWKKILGVIAVCLILVVAYWYGGDAPGSRGFNASKNVKETTDDTDTTTETETLTETETPTETEASTEVEASTETDDSVHTCTISIECSNIKDNWDLLDASKVSCVPSDGWILKETEVTFQTGDTVFDVLQEITKQKEIHLEYSETALYGSCYIEGIGNLYEFDCGELSGWEYSVNGEFPSFGCSKYVLEDGDKIEWRYTCDLGADVGNAYEE